ncbi:MAG: hypothetical protein K2O85_00625 [Helicobacter sp.]|nr:hypothetical protein [Helicobacter sp.]
MELSGMTNTALISGNLFAIKKAMETQEILVTKLLEGMTLAQIPSALATESAPTTGVNMATDGGLDIRI